MSFYIPKYAGFFSMRLKMTANEDDSADRSIHASIRFRDSPTVRPLSEDPVRENYIPRYASYTYLGR